MSTGFNLKSPAYNKGGSLSFKALKPGTGSPNYGSHGWNLLPTEAGSPTLRICRLVQLRSWTISAALMDDLSRAHGRSQPRSRAISAALMGNLSGIFWVTCCSFSSPPAASPHRICVIQSLSHVPLCVTPWTAACQAPRSSTISRSLLKSMSIESVIPSNHLSLCCPLLFLPSIFPSIRVFSKELALYIRWPQSASVLLMNIQGYNSMLLRWRLSSNLMINFC